MWNTRDCNNEEVYSWFQNSFGWLLGLPMQKVVSLILGFDTYMYLVKLHQQQWRPPPQFQVKK